MKEYKSYFRPEIEEMSGYVPGTQPKVDRLIKLNTNENPYPPSPKVFVAAQTVDPAHLRRYPDPRADELCELIAQKFGVTRNMVIAANGSDDVLTWVMRAFTDETRSLAMVEPSYSLYEELAKMQNAKIRKIKLLPRSFSLPDDFLDQLKGANLLIIPRPNAPTGNCFTRETMRQIAEAFNGVLVIDEAYADFANDNCMDLAKTYPNVIVCRTLSKSYSLAGLRLGFVIGDARLLAGLSKLKDSYNVDMIAQILARAALSDDAYLSECCAKVRAGRKMLTDGLIELGFGVVPSEANFVFAMPPDEDGEKYFSYLHNNAIEVRYFRSDSCRKYVRITVGTPEDIATLLLKTKQYIGR